MCHLLEVIRVSVVAQAGLQVLQADKIDGLHDQVECPTGEERSRGDEHPCELRRGGAVQSDAN